MRIESIGQLLGVFSLATLISIGLIYLINAENYHRSHLTNNTFNRHNNTEPPPLTTPPPSNPHWLLHTLRSKLISSLQTMKTRLTYTFLNRTKRSLAESESESKQPIRTRHHHHTNTNNINKIELEKEVCYRTDDVLIVVGLTCCLNFSFVLFVWGAVKLFSFGYKHRRGKGFNRKRRRFGKFDEIEISDGWSSSSSSESEEPNCDNNKSKRWQSMEELRYVNY